MSGREYSSWKSLDAVDHFVPGHLQVLVEKLPPGLGPREQLGLQHRALKLTPKSGEQGLLQDCVLGVITKSEPLHYILAASGSRQGITPGIVDKHVLLAHALAANCRL